MVANVLCSDIRSTYTDEIKPPATLSLEIGYGLIFLLKILLNKTEELKAADDKAENKNRHLCMVWTSNMHCHQFEANFS